MTPRRAKRSPRRAKVSSGRLPGAFWEGFPTHFQATRGDRDAPYSNRRRGRVAPEQGYRLALRLVSFRSLPRDRARKLRKRRTRNSRLCLVVLCLVSSRRCLCSSPRLLRRLRCLRLSLFTRFPFLDSQVQGSTDYGKRIRRMSESGALFHRAGTAIHPQGFKLIEGVYPLKGECEGEGGPERGQIHPPRGVDGLREALEALASARALGVGSVSRPLCRLLKYL